MISPRELVIDDDTQEFCGVDTINYFVINTNIKNSWELMFHSFSAKKHERCFVHIQGEFVDMEPGSNIVKLSVHGFHQGIYIWVRKKDICVICKKQKRKSGRNMRKVININEEKQRTQNRALGHATSNR